MDFLEELKREEQERKAKVNKIAAAIGNGVGTCLKFYVFSGLLAVWYWLPLIIINNILNKE